MEFPFVGKVTKPTPVIAGLTIATLGVVGIATIYSLNLQNKPKLDIENITTPVTAEDLTVKITASGTVLPVQTVNLSPKTSGRIAELLVEQGDRVQQGQKIAVMENQEMRAQFLQSQANVRQAEANLAKALNGTRSEEIAQARARLSQVEANLNRARNGNRPEEIAQTQGRLRQSEANYARIRNGNRPEEIAQAQARLAQTEANLRQAQSIAPQQIQQAQAQIQVASARLNLARERQKRFQDLYNKGAITRDRLDEVNTEFQSATANLLDTQQKLQQVKNNTQQDILARSATVNEAEQRLAQLRAGSRQEEIAQARAEVDQARLAVNISQQGTRKEEIDRLIAEVEQAKSSLQQLENGPRKEEIAQLRAAVDVAKANLLAVQSQLQDTIIVAPFSGIITQRYANVGAFVTPTTSASSTASATSTSIVAIARDLEIKAKVPEVEISKIRPGQEVEIIADAFVERKFKGIVRLVAPEAVVEQNVTTFETRITIVNNENDDLKSGMNVNVNFLADQKKNALTIPSQSIFNERGESKVLVIGKDNKPEFKIVTLGTEIQGRTQILTGLNVDEKVISDPSTLLKKGEDGKWELKKK